MRTPIRRLLGAFVVTVLACASTVVAQQPVSTPGDQIAVRPPAAVNQAPPSTASNADDFYYFGNVRVPLNRSLTEAVVKFRGDVVPTDLTAVRRVSAATAGGGSAAPRRPFHLVTVPGAGGAAAGLPAAGAARLSPVERMRARDDVEFVAPVFHHSTTGARVLPTDEIVLKTKPGDTLQDLVDIARPLGLTVARAVKGTSNEYVLRVDQPKVVDAVVQSRALFETGRFEWAEPNFIQEFRSLSTPNDPLFGAQWHLSNTGQGGGKPGADVNAPAAWDVEPGRSNIVIAIIDTGVDIAHEDLAPNIFVNAGEIPGNGIDDDGNGYVDDVNGWDFSTDDNDPSPSSLHNDNHGTQVAGVAAARGNNGVGVSGACPNCRILPIKITEDGLFTEFLSIAEAIRYAATFADILNNSWGGGAPSNAIDSAIHFAITAGRGGKGSLVLASSGNSAAGFVPQRIDMPAGTYTFRWEYVKNDSGFAGDDTAWLGWVQFPGGEVASFESGALPAGWTTGGSAAWSVVSDPAHADSGWGFTHAAKAGAIADNQTTWVQVRKTVPAGLLVTNSWVSSEFGADGLLTKIDQNNDGIFEFVTPLHSGVATPHSPVSYPASSPEAIAVGASTNFDLRSVYSEYGPQLAFVAPSSGGSLAIETTDRTGLTGDDPGDYDAAAGLSGFGGTSSAAPLAAGIAGLILSRNPGLTRAEVLEIMQSTAAKIGLAPYVAGRNDQYGFGRLDAFAALLATPLPADSPPVFTSQPGDRNVVAGQPAYFTVGVSGSPAPTCLWQASTDSGASWSNLANAGATTTLAIASAAITMSGTKYRCVATNRAGSAISKAATLAVVSTPGPPTSGRWIGTTSQSLAYNFTVNSGARINPLSFDAKTCIDEKITFAIDVPVTGASFFYDNGDQCERIQTSGSFTSPTAASGQLSITFPDVRPPFCAKTCTGTGTFTWTAILAPPPVAFNKFDPPDGFAGAFGDQALTWKPSADAASYEVCVDTTNNNTCDTQWTPVAKPLDINAFPSLPQTQLASSTTYYWQVRAIGLNNTIEADAGQWFSFTTTAFPALSLTGVSLPEGNTGLKPFTFTASLSSPINHDVRVHYETADNTAVAASQFFKSYSNAAPISIPAVGSASPYPSSITVAGVPGPIGKVTVTLANMSHASLSDVDVLLVGPSGQTLLLMSDAGATATGATYVFDDNAAATLPQFGPISSGTYRPTNYVLLPDTFAPPAPPGPYTNTALSAFAGTDPNGTWTLYVTDDIFGSGGGAIAGGWSLSFYTAGDYVPASGDLVIPANTTSQQFSVSVLGDFQLELNESFIVRLSGASTATMPTSTYFSSDLESGTAGWSAQAPWALTTESAHSGTHAWSDSPGGAYGANLNVSLTTPIVNLRFAKAPQLRFWQRRDFAADGFDAGNVYVSADGGLTFTFLKGFTGTDLTWTESVIDLTSFAGQASVRIYFQVLTNGAASGDGWYIDDVTVKEAAPSVLALGVILNDDQPPPTISVSDASVVEGNSGSKALTFTASLSAAAPYSVGVSYQTADGTAGATGGPAGPFSNSSSVSIPGIGNPTPYPSKIVVAGVPSAAAKVTVTLSNLAYTRISDLDVLLVGPTGQTLMLLSDVGVVSAPLAGVTLVFDDSGPALPAFGTVASGTYRPTNLVNNPDTFPSPAPPGPYANSALATFSGLDPNGTWSLYVADNGAHAGGSISGGWSLSFVTTGDYAPTTGQLVFAPGAITQQISVPVFGDTIVEPNETFFVNLTNPLGASIADGQGVGTIIDDDGAAPTVAAVAPVSGSVFGGTPITITGTGFVAGATVTIGGTPATAVNVVSATTITATTPPHAAGVVDVDVANPDLQHATLAAAFTVLRVTPTIAWNSPAAITVGTPLGATQLNATASVPGTFAYNPPPGTVLAVGAAQTLSAIFTPNDSANYTTATASVLITVRDLPTVTVSSTTAPAGGTIQATVANGPGLPGDWVGLYDAGGAAVQWQYLDGSQTLPAIGVTSATVTFTLPATPGTFQVRFFNAAYVLLATSASITTTVPTVTLGAATGSAGGTVTVIVANGPGTPGDWVGLYDAGGNAVRWQYLNGAQVKPPTGIANATLTFVLPATPGTYQVRLFNATYTRVATSGTITVTVPTVTLGATTGTAGGTVTVTIANAPGTPGDWVGLYDANGNPVRWQYLSGTQTLPSVGVTSATLTFILPTTPGTYHARLFNGTYTLVATSGTITTTVPTITLGASAGAAGGTVTVTITNAPGTPGDWAGLYDANGNPVRWQYLNGTQTLPSIGVTSATLTFVLPTTPGTYHARLFNGTYTLVATSGTITTTVPTVTLGATTGTAGGAVTATIANGPGTPGDWVGLYDASGTPLQWQYLNGTHSPPAAGIANATVVFTLPATPGTYHARLFNATYALVATSGTITTSVPTVTLGSTTGPAGGTVTATIANAPGTPGDWVGLYDANGTPVAWQYLNGTQTLPTTGVSNATVTFILPLTPGTYHARLFNGTYVLVATSGTIIVF